MDRFGRLALRIAVGAYIVYAAYKVAVGQMAGGTGMANWVAYGSAAVLSLGALVFCGYAVGQFRKEKKMDKTAPKIPENSEETEEKVDSNEAE